MCYSEESRLRVTLKMRVVQHASSMSCARLFTAHVCCMQQHGTHSKEGSGNRIIGSEQLSQAMTQSHHHDGPSEGAELMLKQLAGMKGCKDKATLKLQQYCHCQNHEYAAKYPMVCPKIAHTRFGLICRAAL